MRGVFLEVQGWGCGAGGGA